jgi:hypothetical protein
MTEVRIFDVEEWIGESLRARARSKSDPLEGDLLRQDTMRPKQELADQHWPMRDELRQKDGAFSDSVGLNRNDRDAH